jgi:hypothetical protein
MTTQKIESAHTVSDIVLQNLGRLLSDAAKLMRRGSAEERRKAAELLRPWAARCSDRKIGYHLEEIADALHDGDAESFWSAWNWICGYYEGKTGRSLWV